MASLTEEIADALARDVLRAAEELGDDNLVAEVSRVIGASSTTTQEAFMTAVRVRVSERRARQMLAQKLGSDWPLQATAPAVPQMPLQALMAVAQALPTPTAVTAASVEQAPEPKPASTPAARGFAEPRRVWRPAEPTSVAAEEPKAEEPSDSVEEPEQAEPQAEPAPVVLETPLPGRVSPRLAASLDKPVVVPVEARTVTPSADTLAAALALASSLPRRRMTPAEPRKPSDPLYPDIEIPDGDWG